MSGHDYATIRRKIMIFSSLVVLAPLVLLLVSDSQRLKEDLAAKAQAPVRFLFEKRRDRLIHLLNKKVEALRLVSSLYTLEELRDQAVMGRVFKSLNEETGTVVDVGLIAADGEQASAYGPQSVAPANFLDMDWFLRARDKGGCVSGVFLGHRRTPAPGHGRAPPGRERVALGAAGHGGRLGPGRAHGSGGARGRGLPGGPRGGSPDPLGAFSARPWKSSP